MWWPWLDRFVSGAGAAVIGSQVGLLAFVAHDSCRGSCSGKRSTVSSGGRSFGSIWELHLKLSSSAGFWCRIGLLLRSSSIDGYHNCLIRQSCAGVWIGFGLERRLVGGLICASDVI